MKRMVITLVIALSSLSAVAVKGDDSPKERKVYTATIDKDGVQRVDIQGGSYFFKPDDIVVKVNVPVELKVRKEAGVVPHNFIIKAPEAGMDVNVSLGTEPKVIRFTPTKTGIYHFYCDKKLLFFQSHKEKGMEGNLEVVDERR